MLESTKGSWPKSLRIVGIDFFYANISNQTSFHLDSHFGLLYPVAWHMTLCGAMVCKWSSTAPNYLKTLFTSILGLKMIFCDFF